MIYYFIDSLLDGMDFTCGGPRLSFVLLALGNQHGNTSTENKNADLQHNRLLKI